MLEGRRRTPLPNIRSFKRLMDGLEQFKEVRKIVSEILSII